MLSTHYDKNGDLLNNGDIVKIYGGKTIEYGKVIIDETSDYVSVNIGLKEIKYILDYRLSQFLEKVLDAAPNYVRCRDSKKMKHRVHKRMARRHLKRLAKFNNNWIFTSHSRDNKEYLTRTYKSYSKLYKSQKKYSNRIVRKNDKILLKGNDYKRFAGMNSNIL